MSAAQDPPPRRPQRSLLRRNPYLAVAGIVVVLVVVSLSIWRWDAEQLGPNLLSDAIMLGLTAFVVERILRADRDAAERLGELLVYRTACRVYTKLHNLWCALVALGCGFDEDAAKASAGDPTARGVQDRVLDVGRQLAACEDQETIVENIARLGADLERQIDECLATSAPYIPGDVALMLYELRESHFLSQCMYLRNTPRDSWPDLGANLLWRDDQQRNIDVMVGWLRRENPGAPRPEEAGIVGLLSGFDTLLTDIESRVRKRSTVVERFYALTPGRIGLGAYLLRRPTPPRPRTAPQGG